MTAADVTRVEKALNEFKLVMTEKLTTLTGEVRELCATTRIEIDHLKRQCDERHGANVRRIDELDEDGKQTSAFAQRLKGMGIPVAICVSVVAVILNIFL